MVQGIVPMCSAQYERMFNTTRIPDKKKDRLVIVQSFKYSLKIFKYIEF